MSIGARLRFARETMGFKLSRVSEQTGIGISSLSEWERDIRDPSVSQLVKLAAVYKKSLDFFIVEEEPQPGVVLWRQRPDREFALASEQTLIQMAQWYDHLEHLCGIAEPPNLDFAMGNPTDFRSYDAESLAHDFRTRHSLGERPATVLLRVLEDVCRVKVFHLEFEPLGTAACTLTDRFGAAVLLNSNNDSWRRNFDLAHELFHLLTWKIFRAAKHSLDASLKEEELADCFAGHLLMPTEALRCAITSQQHHNGTSILDCSDLFELARQFDVSVEALLRQMALRKIVDSDSARKAIEAIGGTDSPWEKRKNVPPPCRPTRFEALASEAIDKGLISTGKYAEFMGVSRRAAMKQFEQAASACAEGCNAKVEVIDA